MNIREILEKFDKVTDSTQVVVVCGASEYGIDFINTDLEAVLSKGNIRNVGSLKNEIINVTADKENEVMLRIENDRFEIDMIVFGDQSAAVYDRDEVGSPKLIIFPENSCVEKHGLHSFFF